MEKKLRKIRIESNDYLYKLVDTYHSDTQNHTLTVRVFLTVQKLTPLIIQFLTSDFYYAGNPLNTGINLPNGKTGTTDTINVNKPNLIRKLILLGIQKGWTGINKIEVQNGMDYLNSLGYETSILKPNTQL